MAVIWSVSFVPGCLLSALMADPLSLSLICLRPPPPIVTVCEARVSALKTLRVVQWRRPWTFRHCLTFVGRFSRRATPALACRAALVLQLALQVTVKVNPPRPTDLAE